jgi:capsular exopolysaccharide synthesis family protein
MAEEIKRGAVELGGEVAERTAAEAKTAVAGEKASKRTVFQVMEAYKMIRTNLLFALATTENHVVVFSSAEPSAGKSTLSANLAIVMAQTGARVVLVDADMRKPVQHRNFRLSKTQGLSKILGGLATPEECIVRQVLPNLDLIPSGTIPPNPSELLGSSRMKALLEALQQQYDYVFIDTPPLGVVADERICAGAVYARAVSSIMKCLNNPEMLETPVQNVRYEEGNEYHLPPGQAL